MIYYCAGKKVAIFVAVLFLNVETVASFSANAEEKIGENCSFKLNSTLAFVLERINGSGLTSKVLLSCEEISTINKMQQDKLTVTTGRKSGKYTICLSDNDAEPCQHIVAYFNSPGIPAKMLTEVFEIKASRSEKINETVERLFLKPSKLLAR